MADVGAGIFYAYESPGVAVLDRLDDWVETTAAQAAASSLVEISHNSEKVVKPKEWPYCSRATWKQGSCDHKTRMVAVPCKARDCPECGPVGRYKIAERIAYGVRQSPCRKCRHGMGECWGHVGDVAAVILTGAGTGLKGCGCRHYQPAAAWLVLTYADASAEDSEFKPEAIRDVENYVGWLRQRVRPTAINHRTQLRVCKDRSTGELVLKRDISGRCIPLKTSWDWGKTELHYAATYELTKRGRLHINLITWPWAPIPQAELQAKWGSRVWIEWVNDDEPIGIETAKAYSPESLGNYLIKLEQSVGEEWGRRVSFDNGWPKVPKEPGVVRAGAIGWRREWEMSPGELANFLREKAGGVWQEITRGEWEIPGHGAACVCFDWIDAPTGPDLGLTVWVDSKGALRSDGPAVPWEPWMNGSNQYSAQLLRPE